MYARAGEWFMIEGMMTKQEVRQVLEFQKHGDHRKFGRIALSREYICGKDLQKYMKAAHLT